MTFTLSEGDAPLLISVPHAGTEIPDELRASYAAEALELPDTDWHVDRLYAFAADLGAGLLVACESRYVIDLNRPSDDAQMYPGANNTELCPTRSFAGDTLYVNGSTPDTAERARRIAAYWQPYHDALAQALERVRTVHGHVVLLDAHSIKSELPWLFEGTLPHFNLGTAGGSSCRPALRDELAAALASDPGFSSVVDGRFKGGQITRSYGRPETGVQAVQLELAWRSYLDERSPSAWDDGQAGKAAPVLRRFVETLVDWRPE